MGQDPDNDLERMRLRKSAATARGGQAFLRLLGLAETRDLGLVARIARAFTFDIVGLRTIGDNLLAFLDALRWGQRRPAHPGPRGTPARPGGDRRVGSHAVATKLSPVSHSPYPRRRIRLAGAGHGRRPALSRWPWPAPLS